MKFTDSHCHLDFDAFSNQREALIEQCTLAGIHQFIIPSISPKNWQKILTLAATLNKVNNNKYNIFPCLGIHPWFLNKLTDNDLAALSSLVSTNKKQLVAIGEAGIDIPIAEQYNNLQKQLHFFDFQIQLAKEQKLPIIVHHRRSHAHIYPMLKEAKLADRGIIHAFSGSYQQAKLYIDLGFKLGIGGTISYPRAKKTINAIKRLPLESLVLETDAPAMPLSGHQGEINSPLRLLDIFNYLVAIRTESAATINQALEKNIRQILPRIYSL